MLLFSTILPARVNLDPQTFFETIVDWNQQSSRQVNRIEDLNWNGELNARYCSDRLELIFDSLPEEQLYGARFVKNDDGIHWRTDVLFFQKTGRILIQLDRTYSEDAAGFNEEFSTPFLISVMIDHGLFEHLDVLPYSASPWILNQDQAAAAESIFYGTVYQSLPVVLVSRNQEGILPLDVEALAWRLKGAAHVLVFEDENGDQWWKNGFSRQMPEPGMISVSYPNAGETIEYFRPQTSRDDSALLNAVCNRIFHYNLLLENAAMPAWMLLKARKIERNAEDETRRQKENESQMSDLFDEMNSDMATLSEQIRTLQAENNAMQHSLHAARQKTAPVFSGGAETEFYPGEMNDVLIEACRLLQRQCVPDGRTADLLDDFLRTHTPSRERKRRMDCIQDAFSSDLPHRRRIASLNEAGFTVSEDGPHYKLVYENDGRYTFSLSKTPSDRRAMKNSLSLILSMLFR